jgi:hypothetical protein
MKVHPPGLRQRDSRFGFSFKEASRNNYVDRHHWEQENSR